MKDPVQIYTRGAVVSKPEEFEAIVLSGNDKAIYDSLNNLKFTYSSLWKYLGTTFYEESIKHLKPKTSFLSEIMEVSESTLYRWRKSRKHVDEKYGERLAELIYLYAYGEDVFESRKAFLEWLNVPNIHLGTSTPLDYLDSVQGMRYIRHLLDKIEYGAPV